MIRDIVWQDGSDGVFEQSKSLGQQHYLMMIVIIVILE
jgi:hypothetical protein